jgi:RNase P/RNase MRP subunit p30
MFDENTRVVAMTNMINLIKATNGKNIVVSSHAGNAHTHRTPYDVAALMATLGLSKNQGLTTMKDNA